MDVLIQIITVGMAVGYITELLAQLLPANLVKRFLTIPLALGGHWLLGVSDYTLAVLVPASGFFALVVISLITRPVVVNNALRR